MIKRIFDISVSFIGLLALSPILLPVIFLVWKQDKNSPFYIAPRVGEGEKLFNMFKLRSMVIDADKTGVDSTSSNDNRITPIGHVIRKYKLDELTQLWNVLIGDMSLVGPRPNVRTETDLYTSVERELLSIRPGITDFSSIIFSDEGEILENEANPDLAYNQLIRPWKSRLGLIYIENKTFFLDLKLIIYTVIAIVSREKAIQLIVRELNLIGVENTVLQVAYRSDPLLPYPPPGMNEVVSSR